MIKVEIDGQNLEAENGEMIIEAADKAGIPIPRYCYHKKLSIAANCRMCLVEVEKAPKPLPACATPIADGMKVFTTSEKARSAQKSIMEFLLINHPLDCPICDQGGECELQDVSLTYGEDMSRYNMGKRSVKDKDIGPLISTVMTRCIHCTRCVRFGKEVAGIPELGCTGRGEETEIGTYIEHALTSEVSGNVIDLCPVGALTNKPYRFTARSWELQQSPAVSPFDCIGANIYLHQRRDEVMRIVPRECEHINETWISDRDRYGIFGVKSHDRLLEPRIKVNGQWKTVDWLTALKTAVTQLGQVLERQGPEQVAGLINPNSTLEEMCLFQKWLRTLKVSNIDHRLQATEIGAESHAKPRFDCPLSEIEDCNAILLVGSNIRKQQPLAGLRVRKAGLNGAEISVLNSLNHEFHFESKHQSIVPPHEILSEMASIAKSAQVSTGEAQVMIDKAQTNDTSDAIAESLAKAEKACIILGVDALNHPQASVISAIAYAIAEKTGAMVNEFPEGGNVMGAHLAGILPDRGIGGEAARRQGLSCAEMFNKELAAYILMNVEPEYDIANGVQALSALDAARYVIQITPYVTSAMETYADVLLPMASYAETSGTYINIEGKWQSVPAAVTAKGNSRPAWKILRVLGNLCQLPDFDYLSSEAIRDEFKPAIQAVKSPAAAKPNLEFDWQDKPSDAFWRITSLAPYRSDSTVRRSIPLQEVNGIDKAAVYLSSEAANQLNVNDGDWVDVKQDNMDMRLVAKVDDRVPSECAYIPGGFGQTNLGDSFGIISIRNINA